MKELKYLDAVTAERIKNKVTDACELMKNSEPAVIPYQYGAGSMPQTSVYVQLPCIYDVLIGHEIKAIVDETLDKLNQANRLKGVFVLNVIRARELYELDKDGNDYTTGQDDHVAFISMMYYMVPSIGYVVKLIENVCRNQFVAGGVLTFQYIEDQNKSHVIDVIESAIEALADGNDYKGYKFTLTGTRNFNKLGGCNGPVVYGTDYAGNLNLNIENTRKQDLMQNGIETIFEHTIGENTNEQ